MSDLYKKMSVFNDDVEKSLKHIRDASNSNSEMGRSSENAWIDMLKKYLPARYKVDRGWLVDSNGKFSDQIDVIIYDRQYSPLIFEYGGQITIPAESVYAVFEAKQEFNKGGIEYSQKKIASVRQLYRTNKDINHAGGTASARKLFEIIGGMLALDVNRKDCFNDSIKKTLISSNVEGGQINIGCVAKHGCFTLDNEEVTILKDKPVTAFLFELFSLLQTKATVPAIDIQAYAKFLREK